MVTSVHVCGAYDLVIARSMIDAVLATSASPTISVTLVPVENGPDEPEAREKLRELGPGDVVVANADETVMRTTAGSTVTYGLTSSADIRATELQATLGGTEFLLHLEGKTTVVRLPLLGEHIVPHALAAIAVGQALALPAGQVLDTVEAMSTVGPGRMQVTERSDGVTVIDDTAEADPRSMAMALKTLAQICEGRRSIAVLGALSVSGTATEVGEAYDRIGRLIVRLNVKQIIVIGQEARHIHNAAGLEGSWDGESLLVDSPDEAYDLLRGKLRERDVVLVKASADAALGELASRVAGDN